MDEELEIIDEDQKNLIAPLTSQFINPHNFIKESIDLKQNNTYGNEKSFKNYLEELLKLNDKGNRFMNPFQSNEKIQQKDNAKHIQSLISYQINEKNDLINQKKREEEKDKDKDIPTLSIKHFPLNSSKIGKEQIFTNKINSHNLICRDNENIKEINLDMLKRRPTAHSLSLRNNMIYRIPCLISQYEHLKEIRLDFNQISEIPSKLCTMKSLTSLSLSHNYIKAIPNEISNLENLQYLFLDNNLLTEFSCEICKLKLDLCYIHNNLIHSLPNQISNLSSLKEMSHDWFIYISQNKIINYIDHANHLEKLIKLAKECKIRQIEKISFIDFILKIYQLSIDKLHEKKLFKKGRNLLHYSCLQGKLNESKDLIDKGFDINSLDDYGCTPLLIALMTNNTELAKYILSFNKCNPNILSSKHGLPLNISIEKKFYDITNMILNHQNFVSNIIDLYGNNAIHILFNQFTTECPEDLKLAYALLQKNFQVNIKNKLQMAPFHLAVKKNNKGAINFALKYNQFLTNSEKFDLNTKCGKHDWSSLHYAVIYSDLEIVTLLINEGADARQRDSYGRKPRDLSIVNSSISKLLLKAENLFYKKTFGLDFKKGSKIIPIEIEMKNCDYNYLLASSQKNMKPVNSIDCEGIDEDDGSNSNKINEYLNYMNFSLKDKGLNNNSPENIYSNKSLVKSISEVSNRKNQFKEISKKSINVISTILPKQHTFNGKNMLSEPNIYEIIMENISESTNKDLKPNLKFKSIQDIEDDNKNDVVRRINSNLKESNTIVKEFQQSPKVKTVSFEELISKNIIEKNLFYKEFRKMKKSDKGGINSKLKFILKLIKSDAKDSYLMGEYLFQKYLKYLSIHGKKKYVEFFYILCHKLNTLKLSKTDLSNIKNKWIKYDIINIIRMIEMNSSRIRRPSFYQNINLYKSFRFSRIRIQSNLKKNQNQPMDIKSATASKSHNFVQNNKKK